MMALVQLCAVRLRAGDDLGSESGNGGKRSVDVSMTVTDDAIREGADEAALLLQFEEAIARISLSSTKDAPLTYLLSIDALDMSGPVATSRLQMAKDLFRMSVSTRVDASSIVWQGSELHHNTAESFANACSAALITLVDKFANHSRGEKAAERR